MKLLTTFAFLLSATIAAAQVMAPGWTETGRLDLTIDGKQFRFVSVIAPDGSPSVTRTEADGMVTISVSAASVGPDGQPGLPLATILIGPFPEGRWPEKAQFQLRSSDGIVAADASTGTSLRLNFPRLNGDKLTFAVGGEALLGSLQGETFVPLGVAPPVAVSGRYQGTLPGE